MAEAATRVRSRMGGRSARRTMRSTRDFTMLPGLTNTLPLCEVMDGSQVEKIDAASMDILENVGVQFRDPIALEDWRKAGAKVEGEIVYLDRGLVRELIATIPEQFTYHARNPANNVALGGKQAVFVPMTGAPSTSRSSAGALTSKSRWKGCARSSSPVKAPLWTLQPGKNCWVNCCTAAWRWKLLMLARLSFS